MAVTFIAEIGMNHNGNFGLIYELIKQASHSGADIAKFQLGWRAGKGEINRLGEQEVQLIQECCDYHKVEPMFSILSAEALKLITTFDFCSVKIASRTVADNPELAREIIALGKRTFVSLGMWNAEGLPFEQSENIEYLWCKSEYPAYPWALTNLPKKFGTDGVVGYSDHSVGIEVPLMALVRGAKVIEKHFTLDKSDTSIRDHALSATPEEFSQLVKLGQDIHKNLVIGV